MERKEYLRPDITFLTYEDICEGETMIVSIRDSTENVDDVGAKRFDFDEEFTFGSDFNEWLWEESRNTTI